MRCSSDDQSPRLFNIQEGKQAMRSAINLLRFDKTIMVTLLVTALALGMVFGTADSHVGLAHDDDVQTFVVMAGGGFASINTEIQAVGGLVNVRFTDGEALPLVLLPEVDDVEIPQLNPAILLPNIENGAALTAMGANSGMFYPPGFSLVIDLEPGTYN